MVQVYNYFQDLFHIRRRKQNKTSGNGGLDGKNGKRIFFVVLYCNDLVVGFQCLIGASEKQIFMFLINMPGIYFFRICYKKINT